MTSQLARHGKVLSKVFSGHKCLYVPFDGKEYIILYPTYEVMMMKVRPKSLQQLSCNVIITSTMGMSDRIDQLNLSAHIKDFCKADT